LKLNAQIRSKDTKQAEEILNSGNDKSLLKILRDETTLIVLMIRVANQEKQDAYKEEKEKREVFENLTSNQLFDDIIERTESK
jgi:hypothetical protein